MFVNFRSNRWLLLPVLVVSLLLLAACSGQAATESDAPAPTAEIEMAEEAHDDQMADDSMNDETEEMAEGDHSEEMDGDSDDSMAESTEHEDAAMSDESTDMASDAEEDGDMADDVMTLPSWQQIELNDARTGETFTLADYAGKTVYVEPFATWCGNCRRQLGNVQSAHAELGDDTIFLALSVEPNIAAETLVDYADKQGYEFTLAAMPVEMLQQLSDEYGQSIGNPPATPHFIIWPDGSTTDLVTGFEDAAEIVSQIQSAGS